MSEFWDKVDKCKHENLSLDYSAYIYCWTSSCTGWEDRCLDCGVFITECGCGSNNGMSGWPDQRRKVSRRKKHGN